MIPVVILSSCVKLEKLKIRLACRKTRGPISTGPQNGPRYATSEIGTPNVNAAGSFVDWEEVWTGRRVLNFCSLQCSGILVSQVVYGASTADARPLKLMAQDVTDSFAMSAPCLAVVLSDWGPEPASQNCVDVHNILTGVLDGRCFTTS